MNITEFIQFKRGLVPIASDVVFHIWGFPIANSTLSLVFITLVVLFVGLYIRRNISVDNPGKLQSFLEMIFEALVSQIKTVTGSEYHTTRIFALISTVFVFVGFSNFLGLMPGPGSITWNGVSIFRTATSDFNTAFGIAFGCLIVFQLVTINDFGLKGFFLKFIPLNKLAQDVKKGGLAPMYIFVTLLNAVLDIIGEIAKGISASLRLFGNMYAGEVLTSVLIGLVAFVLPSFWIVFGLLGALVQTVVFGSLITVFYMQSAGDPKTGAQKSVFLQVINSIKKVIWKQNQCV
jgi:F-type H+-transporting ATPase subunit a